MSDVCIGKAEGFAREPAPPTCTMTAESKGGATTEKNSPELVLCGDVVFDAMRIAEWAHRTRYSKGDGAHHRKAPPGLDRPSYFLHLTQVAWMRSPWPPAICTTHSRTPTCRPRSFAEYR